MPTVPGFEGNVLLSVQETLKDLASYRQHVGNTTEGGERKIMSWLSSWSVPIKNVVVFLENMIYRNGYERHLRQNLINRQSPSEVLQATEVAHDVAGLLAPLETIKKAQDKAMAKKEEEALAAASGDKVDDETPAERKLDVEFMPPSADSAAQEVIKKYQDHALHMTDSSCTLLAEPATEKEMADMCRTFFEKLRGIEPAVVQGLERTYDLGVYDVKTSGEPTTHPHVRVMSFRVDHYAKAVRGFARGLLPADSDILNKDSFPPSACIVALDAGRNQGTHAISPTTTTPMLDRSPAMVITSMMCFPGNQLCGCVSMRLRLPLLTPWMFPLPAVSSDADGTSFRSSRFFMGPRCGGPAILLGCHRRCL